MTELAIDYDTIVGGDVTDLVGPLGLIVHDNEASRLVAISAANVVGTSCRIAATDQPVGTTTALRPERDLRTRLRPASSLLATVLINEDVAIVDGRLPVGGERVFPSLNHNPRKLLGKPVLIHLPARRPVEALVVSTNAKFGVRSPLADGLVFFEHALEIIHADGEDRPRRGDAGALVTTDWGEVVGIVVSARGGSTFAAPIAPLLADLRACVPLDEGIVERHNLLAKRSKSADDEPGPASTAEAEESAELTLMTERAGAAWDGAMKSQRKDAFLKAAALIEESCFA